MKKKEFERTLRTEIKNRLNVIRASRKVTEEDFKKCIFEVLELPFVEKAKNSRLSRVWMYISTGKIIVEFKRDELLT